MLGVDALNSRLLHTRALRSRIGDLHWWLVMVGAFHLAMVQIGASN